MSFATGPLDEAIREVDRLRKQLTKLRVRQITSANDCQLIRAYALAWTNNYASRVPNIEGQSLARANQLYDRLHTSSYRATSRTAYLSTLRDLRTELLNIQSKALTLGTKPKTATPDFSLLSPSSEMSALLARRVGEITSAIETAPLATSIMMGALLEALFLARINAMKDKRVLFGLSSTPKDKTGKPRELKEWGLNDFIEVSHELKWITKPLKDISAVLRDYRNVIHPVKELTLMTELKTDILVSAADARMFWRVICELSAQVAASAQST